MKQVTVWEVKNESGEWEHNHIEDGWSTLDKPKGINASQTTAWKNREWRRLHRHLNDANEIVD